MTDGAREYLDMLTREYAKAGYPHPKTWAFSPDDGEERIYNELKAHGLIKQFTVAMCVLTEQGLSRILERLPATPEANALFEDLKRQYIAAGYPPRRTWAFAPNDDEQEPAYQTGSYLDCETLPSTNTFLQRLKKLGLQSRMLR